MVNKLIIHCFFTLLNWFAVDSLNNGLARTPPMGWSSWTAYRLNINETIFYDVVKTFISSGMKDVGYEYINVDAGWWAQIFNSTANYTQLVRNQSGYTTYAHEKYPNGIENLIKYIHDNGLKYGHYTDAGVEACSKQHLLSQYYKEQDINLFIEWGIDMLKIDACHVIGNVTSNIFEFYDLLATTWNNSNISNSTSSIRPILFSNCHNGCRNDNAQEEWKPYCIDRFNMWRISSDIGSTWAKMLHNIDQVKYMGIYGQPGAWNDPDFLQVGLGHFADNFTNDFRKTFANDFMYNYSFNNNYSNDNRSAFDKMIERNEAHFSLWCITSAPLIAGNDVINMTDNIKNILINKNAIEINQNYLNNAGDIIQAFNTTKTFKNNNNNNNNNNNTDIWYKPLPNNIGDAALLFLNRNSNGVSFNMSVTFKDLPINKTYCDYFDIWKETKNAQQIGYSATVHSQSVKFLKLLNCKD